MTHTSTPCLVRAKIPHEISHTPAHHTWLGPKISHEISQTPAHHTWLGPKIPHEISDKRWWCNSTPHLVRPKNTIWNITHKRWRCTCTPHLVRTKNTTWNLTHTSTSHLVRTKNITDKRWWCTSTPKLPHEISQTRDERWQHKRKTSNIPSLPCSRGGGRGRGGRGKEEGRGGGRRGDWEYKKKERPQCTDSVHSVCHRIPPHTCSGSRKSVLMSPALLSPPAGMSLHSDKDYSSKCQCLQQYKHTAFSKQLPSQINTEQVKDKIPPPPPPPHTHTHTCACMHALTHAPTHPHTHSKHD